jgi:hypothetical protein
MKTMKSTTFLFVLAILLATAGPVLADGKFYWPEPVPPEIPYQRALLLFDGGRETLILQSKYHTTGSTASEFGWVVPVPSVPELASMDPAAASDMFFDLGRRSEPRVTSISDLLLSGLCLLLPLGALVTLLACLLSLFVTSMQFVRRHRVGLILGATAALISWACLSTVLFLFSGSGDYQAPGADVVKAEQVGIYDVQVVKAGQAGDLIQWLNQHRFQFDETDTQVFDQYLQRGWCFVVARIDPTRGAEEHKVVFEGLVAPLIMRFEAETPVYPLALTSTAGHETEILLYVLCESKWHNDGRLELHYAGTGGLGIYGLAQQVEPEGFFSGADLDLPFLCKFKGMLTPEQMREDLDLTPAADRKAYRRHIITW